MTPLEVVGLAPLMARTCGRREVAVGLIDGPVRTDHPDLAGADLQPVSDGPGSGCCQPARLACFHGTLVAGILAARRESLTPGICPGCRLLLYPLFGEGDLSQAQAPMAHPQELAAAVRETVRAGARVLNLSLALVSASPRSHAALVDALDEARGLGVIVVAAAGHAEGVGGSPLTRHPWVIPVVACDLQGRPLPGSTLGASIGRRGVSAPGDRIAGLTPWGHPSLMSGASVAAPLVTGTVALLWSEFPAAGAAEVRWAVAQAGPRGRTIVPPLLNAWGAYQALLALRARR